MTRIKTQSRAHSGAGVMFSLDAWLFKSHLRSLLLKDRKAERLGSSWCSCLSLSLFHPGPEGIDEVPCEPLGQGKVQRAVLQSLHVLLQVGPEDHPHVWGGCGGRGGLLKRRKRRKS